MKNIESYIAEYRDIFENYLDNQLNILPKCELSETIIYSLKNGGKRLRPVLMIITADLLNVEINKVLPFAYALEVIHSSSLVHDDLPALDNDDMRRGRPSCHKKFGEAEGILCGDAMLNYAYEVAIANCKDNIDINCLYALSKLTGVNGMLGGQYLDVTCEKRKICSKEILSTIQKTKTGALLVAPFEIAGILAQSKYLDNLKEFGLNLGVAFQILDDILDVESSKEVLGKSIGKDLDSGKLTAVSVYGLEKAKILAEEKTQKAIDSIKDIQSLILLKDLALYLLKRNK